MTDIEQDEIYAFTNKHKTNVYYKTKDLINNGLGSAGFDLVFFPFAIA